MSLEDNIDGNYTSGYTDNYIKVLMPKSKFLSNTIQKVRLHKVNENGNVVAGQIEKIIS